MMKNRIKALQAKYLPAVLILLFASNAFAQTPPPSALLQDINAFGYNYKNINVRNVFGIPMDTVSLTPQQKGMANIAIKNGYFFIWNVAQQKWTPIGGGVDSTGTATTYAFSGPLVENGGVVTLPSIPTNILSGTIPSSMVSDLDSVITTELQPYLLKSDTVYLYQQITQLQQTVLANRLDSLSDVNTAGRQAGYVLKYNPLTGEWEAKLEKYATDIIITPSGAYNTLRLRYNDGTVGVPQYLYDQTGDNTRDTLEVFENTSGTEFTLQKEPVSVISVMINNVPVSEDNYSIVGLLLTIVGYTLDPTDKLIIKYSYPKN